MVLYTTNKRYEEFAVSRLNKQNIDYCIQPIGCNKINLFFGRRECIEVIQSLASRPLNELTPEEDEQLACTPVEELLDLDLLKAENIKDTLHAYQLAKRCNEKRVMAEAVRWGEKGARINAIAPGIVVTPLAIDEFNGPRGDFYKNMFASCPAGRPATADEIANVAELLMSDKGAFISGSTFLIDGGATASYYYGPLRPKEV